MHDNPGRATHTLTGVRMPPSHVSGQVPVSAHVVALIMMWLRQLTSFIGKYSSASATAHLGSPAGTELAWLGL